jgi:hypothetical protein
LEKKGNGKEGKGIGWGPKVWKEETPSRRDTEKKLSLIY